MNYHWSDCPGCGCQVSINYTVYSDRISGSVRRWSADRSVNDGRPFQISSGALSPDGGFVTTCVCGQEITVISQAASGERDAGLRVTLTSD